MFGFKILPDNHKLFNIQKEIERSNFLKECYDYHDVNKISKLLMSYYYKDEEKFA